MGTFEVSTYFLVDTCPMSVGKENAWIEIGGRICLRRWGGAQNRWILAKLHKPGASVPMAEQRRTPSTTEMASIVDRVPSRGVRD